MNFQFLPTVTIIYFHIQPSAPSAAITNFINHYQLHSQYHSSLEVNSQFSQNLSFQEK